MKELGRNIRLYINDTLVNCEITHTFSRAFEFLAKADRQQALSFIRRQKSGSVGVTMLVNYAAQTGYKTFIQVAESGAEENFSLWDGDTGSPRINFKGYIEGYTQTGDLKTLATLTANILISGDLEVLVSGSYKMKSTNIDEITVYSAETGTVPYSIRNTQTGITTSGTLNFEAPAISGGLANGLFADTITGLTSGTKYEVTVGLSTVKEVYTQFNIPMGVNDQHLFSSSVADYLTETDIGDWGLPKTVEQCEINGTANDYSGANNNGEVKGSPAKSFLVGATLTFTNTAPYTRPANNTDVAINKSDGVVAGSYNAATGAFTISTAGRIDSLSVTVGSTTYEVFLCSGAGLRQNWEVGTVEFQILYSAATVATTNTNAFNQARGATDFGTIYQSVAANTGEDNIFGSFTIVPVNIAATSSFDSTGIAGETNVLKIEIMGEPTGSPRVRALFQAFRNGVNIPIPNGYGFFSYTLRCKVYIDDNIDTTTRVRWSPNASFTLVSTVPTPNSWQDIELTTNSTSWDTCEIIFEFSGVGTKTGIVIYLTDVEVISNTLIPSALDASGNSTGFDVFGNALPAGYTDHFFDLQETLNFKTGGSAADETYADLPPPNVSNNEYGVGATDTTPNSKRDLIYIAAGASAAVDAEIIKYQNAVAADLLPKIIKRA